MALLRQTNPIVTTYPMYIVPLGDYTHEDIFNWLTQHTKHVGIGRTLTSGFAMQWRVYARLNEKIEALFILKYSAKLRYNDLKPWHIYG